MIGRLGGLAMVVLLGLPGCAESNNEYYMSAGLDRSCGPLAITWEQDPNSCWETIKNRFEGIQTDNIALGPDDDGNYLLEVWTTAPSSCQAAMSSLQDWNATLWVWPCTEVPRIYASN